MEAIKNLLRQIVPRPVVRGWHWLGAVVANLIYFFPGRRLRVFAVTGTDGKTTTALLLHSILTTARRKVGLMSTVRFSDGKELWRNDTKLGTQNPFVLQRLLRRMVANRATEAVLEVTSIGLDQHRIWGIPIDTAILTNVTSDHLEYHHTKEAYRQAKETLFVLPHRVSVVNGDDPSAAVFLSYPAVRKLAFRVKGTSRSSFTSEESPPAGGSTSQVSPERLDVVARGVRVSLRGTRFRLGLNGESAEVNLKLIGQFHVENALAAAAAAHGANIPLDTIVSGLEALPASPGRMELVDHGQTYAIVLDYAHTPDALKKVFETLRPLVKGRIIHVGGATGRRYPEKRPLLGALAGRYADIVIVTDEDPYDEDPSAIMADVVAGVKKGAGQKSLEHGTNFFTILDRAEAIRKALSLAKATDLVLITGKGDEEVMVVGSKLVPYSDRKVIEEVLERSDVVR
ncbi:UDP-N-acetylmuramoyl-L-alanyl-D-glutamate--2,6-diaminopimelate ligase [Candidatus Berkelbacteria bacterium]|nr:UDP-N-acetylmuramoyl-L-alanyl-D-glutamate--2,6-diaminopimelate ligase [Candidatus Berkelbacteria bacterium]